MILVAGATGTLGGLIVRRLLAQGKRVRMLVRDRSLYRPLAEAGAQPTIGDLKKRPSLDEACAGIEAVITTANSALRGGEDSVQTVDLDGNCNLIDAARSAGVKQFIFTSALAADINSPVPFLQAKARSEAHLRGSGLPYTILAPDAFMEVWVAMVVGRPARAEQPVTLVGEGRRRHSFVSVADVVAFATAAVGHSAAMNQRLVLGGPQALSYRDAVGTYERALGRTIPMRSVSPGEPVPGLPDPMAQVLAGMEMFDSIVDMTATARIFGVRLTTLEEFARRESTGTTA